MSRENVCARCGDEFASSLGLYEHRCSFHPEPAPAPDGFEAAAAQAYQRVNDQDCWSQREIAVGLARWARAWTLEHDETVRALVAALREWQRYWELPADDAEAHGEAFTSAWYRAHEALAAYHARVGVKG